MRKPPEIIPPETLTHRTLELIQQERGYRLITPLYGGGVAPSERDPLTPIRGSEIRGQLRFWWRATRGGQFPTWARLQEQEDAIWGAANQKEDTTQKKSEASASKPLQTVQIEVTITKVGESKKALTIVYKGKRLDAEPVGVPKYVVFPLRPTNDDLRSKTQKQLMDEMKSLQHNLEFSLKITYAKEHERDIQAALWAWETFGGLGARTRRGFGALHLLTINGTKNIDLPADDKVKEWLNGKAQGHVVSGTWPKDVPHLEHALSCEVTTSTRHVLSAWDTLVKRYSSFRQLRTKGLTGRSLWPEAETIRTMTHRRHYDSLGHPQKFPRAAFGLPIIFHFKDDRQGDPKDTTVQGAEDKHERFASPLILRPLVCSNGNAVGLAVLLKGSVLPPLVLKDVASSSQLPKEGKPAEAQLNREDLKRLNELNEQKLRNETDVLQAFLQDLKGRR